MYSKEVVIPEGITAEVSGNKVKVTGQKGSLERKFIMVPGMKIEKADKKIVITTESERRKTKAVVGTTAAHIRNMIDGVTKGYAYRLRICYSHFPITTKIEKDKVMIQNFLGARTSRAAQILSDVQVKAEGSDIVVSGIDVDKLSHTAANIEQACRIVGFDKKRFQDGIFLVSREG
jgi:large subunit ribosomal protein L6